MRTSLPKKSRHTRWNTSEKLEREGDGVDVGAVVGDDGKGKDDQAELPESAQVRDEDSCKKTTNSWSRVPIHIRIISIICGQRGSYSGTQHLSEEKRKSQTSEGPEENWLPATSNGLIDCIVCSITGPTYGTEQLVMALWRMFECWNGETLFSPDRQIPMKLLRMREVVISQYLPVAKPNTEAAKERAEPASDKPTPMGIFSKLPEWANSPRTIKKIIKQGIHEYRS